MNRVKSPANHMKDDPFVKILTGILALSALISAVFCMLYINNQRELRSLQSQVMSIQTRRASVNSLAQEAVEYSKTHPAIDPILENAGLKPKSASSKPAGR